MLVGIFGPQGSGKTLYALWYVMRYYVERGRYSTALSNVRMISPNPERPIGLLDQAQFKALDHMQDALVVIDEAYLWLDSRTPSRNRQLSYLVLQSRKRGFDILFTAQIKSSVDLRLRDQAEFWITCENKGYPHRLGPFHYIIARRDTTIPRISEMELPSASAAKLLPYYDTREIVPIA